MAKAKKDGSKELLLKLRQRYEKATEADRENRQKAQDDLKFLHIPGEQWDSQTRRNRGERPMFEFNKLRITVKKIVNDMRANRPAGKVRGVEDGDTETAEVCEGLIRNIWNVSDGDTAIDHAAEFQVGGGMGAWRLTTEYEPDSFYQCIKVEAIRNPFCLYADPAAQDALKRDAQYWILTDRIAKEAFEAKYPKAEAIDFEASEFDDEDEWDDGETVRICEYWWKEPTTKRLLLLSNGQTVDAAEMGDVPPEGVTIVKERTAPSQRIMMAICSGDAVLEGPTEWAGSKFPFVMVFGEQMQLDGKTHWFGLTRFAKDAQRAYNYSRSLAIESIAMAPQAKFWATAKQAEGENTLNMWAEAHKKNYPVMLYTADPQAPGPPQRMGGADVPVALIQEMQFSSDDIKATTGIFDASLGNQSNETSGVAIRARQAQGEIATFNYMDNLAKGIRLTWELLLDLIPKIYDTPRSLRILGKDGAEDYAEINSFVVGPDGQPQAVNDLTRGKYDVTVTVGPSFSTQRQEAAETYTNMVQGNPGLFPMIGDIIARNLDLPGADEIADRLKAMLPPQIQALEQKEGAELPPEAQAAMAQAQQMMAQVQEMGQALQQQGAELAADKASAEAEKGQLAVAKAQLEASYQQKLAQIAQKEAALAVAEAQAGTNMDNGALANDRAALSAEVQNAMAEIRAQAADFMAQAAAAIANQPPPQVVVANPPKQKVVRVRRVNGELVGTVDEIQ